MIDQILKLLQPEQRQRLMYAFENEFAQFIELPNGKFIGVNITPISNLKCLETVGVWAYGEIEK